MTTCRRPIQNTAVGGYIRWQLGDWGLTDLQAAGAGRRGAGRGGRLDPRPDRRGDRRLWPAPGRRGRTPGRRAGDGRRRGRYALGGRLRRRAAPARAVLGPERGRQLRPLRHAAGRALDARGPHRAGPALAPDRARRPARPPGPPRPRASRDASIPRITTPSRRSARPPLDRRGRLGPPDAGSRAVRIGSTRLPFPHMAPGSSTHAIPVSALLRLRALSAAARSGVSGLWPLQSDLGPSGSARLGSAGTGRRARGIDRAGR